MLTYLQSIILGLLQGATELFPISSLGHSVLLPSLLGWHIDQSANYFLIFLVATHLATSLVLFAFFYREWLRIIKAVFTSLKNRKIATAAENPYEKLAWLLIVSTIPAGILGLLFQDKLQTLFASPRLVAIFLILNGVMLFGAEMLKKKSTHNSTDSISKMSWAQGIKIGFAQALALIPGFSRTGATLGGGLLVGLNHADAARFSFLLATPIIFAAAALKLPELFTSASYTGSSYLGPLLAGAFASAAAAYLSVRFLTTYFQTKTLRPFAVYCMIAGIGASLFFFF
jgi:undecaprenyl-diphosphatase